MSSDLVQKFPTLGECNRYTNGMCSTRSCLIRGGWKQGAAVDYDLATCETRDIRKTIEALEGEVAKLLGLQAEDQQSITDLKAYIRQADARAERLEGEVARYRERHKEFMTLQNALERVAGERVAADARAERLRVALEVIAYNRTAEAHSVFAARALEDDKPIRAAAGEEGK